MNPVPFRQMVVGVEKHAWLSVALVAGTALGMRVLALISLQKSICGNVLLMDEQVYHQWARP